MNDLSFITNAGTPRRETLFEQVSRLVAECIRQGKWKPGEMLPNEVELAAAFSVSQGTMRRALRILTDNGVLIRQQGRGTFVAEFSHNEDQVYHRYISLKPDDETQTEASPTSAELVTFEKVSAPWSVMRVLKLETASEVIHAVRLLKASSGLVTYDELWCLANDFRALTAENLAHHEEKMLYAFYQRACGVTILRREDYAKAVLMPEDLCRRYGLKNPLPVIEVQRISFTYNDRPVEYRRQLSITEHYHFKL